MFLYTLALLSILFSFDRTRLRFRVTVVSISIISLRIRYRTPECLSYGFSKRARASLDDVLKADTLAPLGFGGFGNQFSSFIRCLFLCYILAFEQIALRGMALGFERPFTTTDGIRVLQSDIPPKSKLLTVNAFEADGSAECPLDDVAIAATIRDELVGCLPRVEVNASTLYICARGGELIIPGTPFWWHGQPPCQYYLDAMKMDGAKQTVVMSNADRPSPCVDQLVRKGAVYASTETPLHDLARFVHAKRMVASRTSFTTAIMLLSQPKDVLYAFVTQYSMSVWPRHSFLNDYYDRFGPHHKCRATKEYDEKVLKHWEANELQMQMMTDTQTGCVWEYG
jgi:hypothetical protein